MPRRRVTPPDSVAPPAGPDRASTGFVRELIDETNRFAGATFLPADLVDLHLSAPGFSVPPVQLHRRLTAAGSLALCCTVVLHPLHRDPTQRPSDTVEVRGLVDWKLRTCRLTLATDDPLSGFASLDSDSGHVLIRVDLRSLGDDLPKGVYLRAPLRRATGVETTFLADVWDAYQHSPVYEGVVYDDGAVSSYLAGLIDSMISDIAAREPPVHRPGSAGCVRDLVDPGISPFIDGESVLTEEGERLLERARRFEAEVSNGDGLDRWGRRFRVGKYQCLPTEFSVSTNGTVSIDGQISDLDKTKYPGMYSALAQLFEIFLPRFERVYAYLKELTFVRKGQDVEDGGLHGLRRVYRPNEKESKLRLRLRVITQIVVTELRKHDDFADDEYRVEGISSEHIIMAGIYVVNRDEDFKGAELEFRRHFLDFEASALQERLAAGRHWRADQIVEDGVRPLGSLTTPRGRMIVFPNSHIHKFSRMTRAVGKGVSQLRLVVFLLVDPDRDVLSTTQVVCQQGTPMHCHDARKHRLRLFEERKTEEEHLRGVRKIKLCEL